MGAYAMWQLTCDWPDDVCTSTNDASGETAAHAREIGKEEGWIRVRTQRARERAVEDRVYVVDGLDLRRELVRLWRVAQEFEQLARGIAPPAMKVRHSRKKKYTSGCAYLDEHRIVLTLRVGADWADAAAVLAHELAHHVCPVDTNHGLRFWRAFGEIVERAYGARAPAPVTNKWECHQRYIAAIRATRERGPGGEASPPGPLTFQEAEHTNGPSTPNEDPS